MMFYCEQKTSPRIGVIGHHRFQRNVCFICAHLMNMQIDMDINRDEFGVNVIQMDFSSLTR